MPAPFQRSFAGGELDPTLHTRADHLKFTTGVRLSRNFYVLRGGGLANRPGTELVGEAKDSTKIVRGVPFVFNASQAYALEFGHLTLRIFVDRAQLIVAGIPAWDIATTYVQGDIEQKGGVNYYALTTTVGEDPALFPLVWYPLDGVVFEFPTPYEADQLFDLQVAQSADTMYITHPAHKPRKLQRLGHTVWTLAINTFLPPLQGPTNITATSGGGSGTTQRWKVTSIKAESLEESLPGYAGAGVTVRAFPGASTANGVWSAVVNYLVGTVRTDLGVSYVSILPSLNKAPHLNNGPGSFWWKLSDGIAIQATAPAVHGVATGDAVTFAVPTGFFNNPDINAAIQGKEFTVTVLNAQFLYLQNTVGNTATHQGIFTMGIPFVELVGVGAPSLANNHVITWTPRPEAREQWVYRNESGVYGFVGAAIGDTFTDTGKQPDSSLTPPERYEPFPTAGNFPAVVGFFQQSIVYAATDNKPETFFRSRPGDIDNFSRRIPLNPDDPIIERIVGHQVNRIRHVIELDNLLIFTEGAEFVAMGDSNGALSQDEINLRNRGQNGSARVPPVVVDRTVIYLQARGSVVRSLAYDINSGGFSGRDQTTFARHLFRNHTITSWAWVQNPEPQLWATREDGLLLCYTFLQEEQINGWTRHDTDGFVECVLTLPEGDEDALYMWVRRTIGGQPRRFLEALAPRRLAAEDYDGIRDPRFLDSHLIYDGEHLGLDAVNYVAAAGTMTLTTGTSFDAGEPLTLQASLASFQGGSGDVGRRVRLRVGTEKVDVLVTASIDSDTLTCVAAVDVPATLQGVPTTRWYLLTSTVGNVDHLEGKTAGIFADGEERPQQVVTAGVVAVGAPAEWVLVGLPIRGQVQLLTIDAPSRDSIPGVAKLVSALDISLLQTLGLKIGPDEANLTPVDLPVGAPAGVPFTGTIDQTLLGEWANDSGIFIQQDSPFPACILGVAPVWQPGGR